MIQLSQTAINEILRLKAKQSGSPFLRLSTASKGCLALSYVIQFDTETTIGDQSFRVAEGLNIAVHDSVLPHLQGLVIDYSEDMMGGGFRFHNPNAKQVCSCGGSFSLSDRGSLPTQEIS